MYNKYVSLEKITEYDLDIDSDKNIPAVIKDNPVIREVCRAGLYLCEELDKMGCPDDLIVRIQFTAAQLSFGRDIWEVHAQMLEDYKNNKLELAPDLTDMN